MQAGAPGSWAGHGSARSENFWVLPDGFSTAGSTPVGSGNSVTGGSPPLPSART